MNLTNGRLAAILVVVAILGSLGVCYFGSVETVERTKSGWEQVTDVAGLYDYTEVPLYSEYDPVTNYTGWTGAGYTTTPYASLYVMNDTVTDSDTVTMGISANETYSNHDSQRATLVEHDYWTYLYSYTVGSETATFGGGSAISVVYLADMLSGVSKDCTVEFGEGSGLLVPSLNTTSYRTWDTQGITWGFTDHHYEYTLTSGQTYVKTAVYDHATATVTAYGSDGAELWSALASDCRFVYGGDSATSYSQTVTNPVATTYTTSRTYMDVRYGSTLIGGQSAIWSNGQSNGSVTMVITGESSSRLFAYGRTDSGGGAYGFQLLGTGSGWVCWSDGAGWHNIGEWPAVAVTFDALNDEIVFRPVKTFSDFQTFEVTGTEYTVSVNRGVASTLPLKSVEVTAYADGFSVAVTGTICALGVNTQLMDDPTISVGSLFPELSSGFRLDLGSPAVAGDSLTFSGHTVTVSDGAYSVNGKTHALGSVSFKVEDGTAYAMFNSDRTPSWVELGAADGSTLSLSGEWYFDTSVVYKPVTESWTEVTHVWGKGATWNGFLLLVVGILAVLSLVLYTRMDKPFGWVNGAIVVVMIALLLYMLV